MVASGFGMFNRSFHWATFAIPALLVGPAYLRGEVPFGVISQAQAVGCFRPVLVEFDYLSSMFMQVLHGFAWFYGAFTMVFAWF